MKKIRTLGLIVTSLVLSASVLSGCGTTEPANSTDSAKSSVAETTVKSEQPAVAAVELNYWNPFTGDDGKAMAKLVDSFNQENQGKITVKMQTMNSDDYYAKLPIVENAGTGIPDVNIIHLSRLPYFASKNMLTSMDDEIAKMGLKKEDFIATTWDAGIQKDGKRYSVPLDTHPFVMFYNKKMLTDLGYTEKDLKDLKGDKFIEMCKKATSGDKFGVGFIWTWMTPAFYSVLSQNGGSLVSANDPGKALFNSPEGVKAAQFYMDLLNAKVTNKPGSDHVALFKQGKSLFCVDGIWSSTGMDAVSGLDWGEMFLPQVGSKGAEWADSHNLVEMKQPKADSAKAAAANTFIKYLSDNSIEWAKGGQVAARLSVLNTPEFKSLKWGFTADKLDWFSYPAAVVTSGNMQDAIGPALTELYSGKVKDVKTALDKAEKDADAKAAQTLGQ